MHEWLARHGGSENVFDVMARAFPDADLLCLWSDVPGRYPGRELTETWLAHSPLRRHKALAMPFMVPTWRNRRSGGYEWALISSHLFAHHATFADSPSGFRKYVYVHSPARYLWVPDLDKRGGGRLRRLAGAPLRAIDKRRAREPYALAANSDFVRRRIARVWDRDAAVIHPPVASVAISESAWAESLTGEERQLLEGLPDAFVLGASRLVPYKRLDLVIDTADELGLPAVIAGSGPERARLEAHAASAGIPVTLIPAPSDAVLYSLYRAATVFVFPPVEDFGIMPVEALATGTPVVVGPQGGAAEIVADRAVGAVAESTSARDLADAADRASRCAPDACVSRAAEFDTTVFQTAVRQWVAQ